jgi:Mg2+-importing ATPase
VIFVIRTPKVPFFNSRASWQLALTTFAVVVLGAVLPFTPIAHLLGFVSLPAMFFVVLALMVAAYLGLVELGKWFFYKKFPQHAA